MPNRRIPSFNPGDYVVVKPRLDRDVCMIHHSIRKPKYELISIDEPGALNEHHHLRLEYSQPWYYFRTKILKRDFLYQQPLTIRHNPSSANMAPNTNIDLYTAGSTSMPQLDHYHLVLFRRLVYRREERREKEKKIKSTQALAEFPLIFLSFEQPPTATRSPSPSKNSACSTMCTSWSSARTSRRSLGSLKSTVRTNYRDLFAKASQPDIID
jgi:hypothetical protein